MVLPTQTWLRAAGVVGLLTAATIIACLKTPEPVAAPLAGVVLELPPTVNGLIGQQMEVSEAEKQILPPDTQFAKMAYSLAADDHLQIGCQIVLSGADQRSIHRPEACLQGQGWKIQNGGTIPIALADGSTLDVMKLVIARPVRVGEEVKTLRSLYLYWFVSKEATTPYHWERIAKTNFDLLLHNQTHRWAYIIVNAPVLQGFAPGGLDEQETERVLTDFISTAAPQFQRVGNGVEVPPLALGGEDHSSTLAARD